MENQSISSLAMLISVSACRERQQGEFDNSHSIDVDSEGNIYVSDKDNHRIQIFSSRGDFITAFGCEGTGGGQFTHLHGIAAYPISAFVYTTDTETLMFRYFQ